MSEYVCEMTEIYENTLDAVPREVREPIVRCRDCKHFAITRSGHGCYRWMTLDCYENPVPRKVEPDGFCAWGKRKEREA